MWPKRPRASFREEDLARLRLRRPFVWSLLWADVIPLPLTELLLPQPSLIPRNCHSPRTQLLFDYPHSPRGVATSLLPWPFGLCRAVLFREMRGDQQGGCTVVMRHSDSKVRSQFPLPMHHQSCHSRGAQPLRSAFVGSAVENGPGQWPLRLYLEALLVLDCPDPLLHVLSRLPGARTH
jgi:hypothetical protein